MMGFTRNAARIALAMSALMGGAAFIPHEIEARPVYRQPAPAPRQAPAPDVARVEDTNGERDRWRYLSRRAKRNRRYWDGKNRTPGDRAHKRWKQQPRAG